MKKNMCLICVAVLILVTALFGCGKKNESTIRLYFANPEKTELKCEERSYDGEKSEMIFIDNVIKELLKGPSGTALARIIPDGTKLLSVQESNGRVIIDFSEQYNSMQPSDELLARHSIAKTLFEIDGITKVEILVNGNELLNANGDKVGEISKDSLITTPAEDSPKKEAITLYFSDEAAMYLVPEAREAQIVDNSLEKTIITELINGPQNKSHKSTIPEGTKLLSVETKDGICFVNFSQEFVSKHNGGSSGEYITVYSVVNSLTELDNVKKVQFLIEGNKLEVFKHMMFNEPFERDNNAIAQ